MRRALIIAVMTAACGAAPVTTPWPTPEVGVDLDGQRVRLDPNAARPAVLIFWATWCGHCKRLLADVQGWRGQRDFELVAINLREPAAHVARFVERGTVPGRIALDLDGAVAAAYDGQPVPTAIVVAGGRVFGRVRGRSRRNAKALLGMLDAALAWSARQRP